MPVSATSKRSSVSGAAVRRGCGQAQRDAALIGEFHGIVDQRGEHLAQPPGIAAHGAGDIGRHRRYQIDTFGRGLRRQRADDAFDQIDQVEIVVGDLPPAPFDPGEILHIGRGCRSWLSTDLPDRLETAPLLVGQLAFRQLPDRIEDAAERGCASPWPMIGQEVGAGPAFRLRPLPRPAQLLLDPAVARDVVKRQDAGRAAPVGKPGAGKPRTGSGCRPAAGTRLRGAGSCRTRTCRAAPRNRRVRSDARRSARPDRQASGRAASGPRRWRR